MMSLLVLVMLVAAGCTADSRTAPGTVQLQAQEGSPVISSIDPVSGPFGTRVTISGGGFTPNGNTVNFIRTVNGAKENKTAAPDVSSADGTRLVFTLNRTVTLCPPGGCFDEVLAAGTYDVVITNPKGQSNAVRFTITE